MEILYISIAFLVGAAVATAIVWLLFKVRLAEAHGDAQSRVAQADGAHALAQQQIGNTRSLLDAALEEKRLAECELRDLQTQNSQGHATLKEQQTIAARVPELLTTLSEKEARIERLLTEERRLAEELQAQKTYASQVPKLEAEVTMLETESKTAARELTEFREREATFNARLEEFQRAQEQLKTAFTALSSEALKQNNEMFLQLAKTELEKTQKEGASDLEKKQKTFEELVKPIKENLDKYDHKLAQLDKDRMEVYGKLTNELDAVKRGSDALRGETVNLVNALKAPGSRGRWGEIQLRRVVEHAGMIEHCDFDTQVDVATESGRLRPDLTVKLPGGKVIVVDAKVPMTAFYEACECTDPAARTARLMEHSEHLRRHIDSLSAKEYWNQFENSPDFVLMFLPLESLHSVAMEHAPELFERAFERKVIVATPSTLFVLLRAAHLGWRQERLAEDIEKISECGRELYSRVHKFVEHFSKIGSSLESAVKAYNAATGSLESRVLTQARKFKDLGAGDEKDIPETDSVETSVRQLNTSNFKLIENSESQ